MQFPQTSWLTKEHHQHHLHDVQGFGALASLAGTGGCQFPTSWPETVSSFDGLSLMLARLGNHPCPSSKPRLWPHFTDLDFYPGLLAEWEVVAVCVCAWISDRQKLCTGPGNIVPRNTVLMKAVDVCIFARDVLANLNM